MLRLLATAVIALIADTVALLVAAVVLDGLTVDGAAFVVSVVVFAGLDIVAESLIRQTAIRNAPAILGSSALLATLVSLVLTTVLTDGLRISGLLTWILATVIVWLVALAARMLLPLVIFKKVLQARRDA